MEQKEIKLEVHSMKESSDKAMEINIELMLNVDEQQDDKIFKIKWDIDDSDEVEEITATRISMQNRFVWVACNQTLA